MLTGFAPDAAYDPDTITQKTTRTRPSQELTKWAEASGKGDEFRNAVFDALYARGREITDIPNLFDLAESVGLSRKEAETVLETRSYKDALHADWMLSLEVDPEYVPSVWINGELLVNPQEYKLLTQLMKRHRVPSR